MPTDAEGIARAESLARSFDWEAVRNSVRDIIDRSPSRVADASPDIVERAHVLEARALYMLEGNSSATRTRIGRLSDGGASLELRALLGRLHAMSGDYASARSTLVDVASRAAPEVETLARLVGLLAAERWETHPANFYTYRYSLLSAEEAEALRVALLNAPSDIAVVGQGRQLVELHRTWNEANLAFDRQNYMFAIRTYQAAMRVGRDYLASRYGTSDPHLLLQPDATWVAAGETRVAPAGVLAHVRGRHAAIGLRELHHLDWQRPRGSISAGAYANHAMLLNVLRDVPGVAEESIDGPVAVITFALAPLAIAEAALARRQYDDSDDAPGAGSGAGAEASVNQVLALHTATQLLSEVIERPFSMLVKARVLLGRGDAQYKARVPDPTPERGSDGALRHQGLLAARSYHGLIDWLAAESYGGPSAHLATSTAALRSDLGRLLALVHDPVAEKLALPSVAVASADDRRELRSLGDDPRIPEVESADGKPPGLGGPRAPHEAMIHLKTANPAALREGNAVLYAIVAQAEARLAQLRAGFNWLGYRDDYVPPWRFGFLLERARYFADHAAKAQSGYLTFLSNAEREDQQEQSAAHQVAQAQANVGLETGRIAHSRSELLAVQAARQLADVAAQNTEDRFHTYLQFDAWMKKKESESSFWGTVGGIAGFVAVAAVTGGTGTAAAGAGLLVKTYADQRQSDIARTVEGRKRGLEKRNLQLAAREARRSAAIAATRVDAQAAALEVATLQRAAALMHHDFARSTLQFLRNRTVNAELWHRLAGALRDIADSYLERAIELAFLSERAFELETGRHLGAIRLDYDVGQFGEYLAADFLKRDLDSLEHALLTDERLRRQRVRYVVSLSRDFPAALDELRETGRCLLPLTLMPLEVRFPGLFNLKVASVAVLPIALMDPTRFSLRLTHFGVDAIRTKNSGASSVGGSTDPATLASWCSDTDASIDRDWPLSLRILGPETAVFSGLTRVEELQDDTFFAANERGAFEGTSPAATWQLDMSMRENRVVPETLADVILSVTLGGYYDGELAERVAACVPQRSVEQAWLSARELFSDAFHGFVSGGELRMRVTDGHVPLGIRPGRVRNVGLLLQPPAAEADHGRLFAHHRLELLVEPDGSALLRSSIPQLTMAISRLSVELTARFGGPVDSTEVRFEEGSRFIPLTGAARHVYSRSGIYLITVRTVHQQVMTDHVLSVAVSSQEDLPPPFLAFPTVAFSPAAAGGAVLELAGPPGAWLRGRATTGASFTGEGSWRVELAPGLHCIDTTLARELVVELDCSQRTTGSPLTTRGLLLTTNRTFDDAGLESTTAPNALTTALLGGNPISPLGEWRVTIRESANPFLRSVNRNGAAILDLSEIGDAVLAIEYEATSG